MPRHDYICPNDQTVVKDQFRSFTEGGRARVPSCPLCHHPMQWLGKAHFDVRSDSEAPTSSFAKFTTRDGRNNLVEVDSLHKLRQIERESEQLARNGEGQQITFRAWANKQSNMDSNTHGDRRAPEITKEMRRKFGLQSGTRPLEHSDSDGNPVTPEREFGPGVNESNASALPMSGTE